MTEPAAKEAPAKTGVVRDDTCLVTLSVFEGPLDLLLHLIQKHELDIFDIPIGFITERYLEYISMMEKLSIDIASEYLVMAATLAHIKSKMLLPTPPPDQDDTGEEGGEDPREELVRRLLEYQKYKQAASDLASRSKLGLEVFARGSAEPEVEGPAPLAPVGVFSLIDAFNRIFSRRKVKVEHEVNFDRISITERINEIVDRLKLRPRCTLEELVPETASRWELVITFLALLEMTRLRLARLYQSAPLSSIHVELALLESDPETPSDLAPEEPAP